MRSKRSEWVNNASIIAGTWWICVGIMCVPIATLNGWTWIKKDVKYVNIFEIYTSNILEWTWTSEVESSNKCVYFNRIDFCFGSHSFETRIGNPILLQSMCFEMVLATRNCCFSWWKSENENGVIYWSKWKTFLEYSLDLFELVTLSKVDSNMSLTWFMCKTIPKALKHMSFVYDLEAF